MRSAGADVPSAEPNRPEHGVLRQVLTMFGTLDDVVAVEPVGRAWSNRVWTVRTTGGRYAVKEMLNPWNDPHWREWLCEAIAFEQLAVAAGVHAPRSVVTSTGEAMVDVDDRTFRVHEWLGTAEPCPDGAVSIDVARAVARDLATMHALHVVPARTDAFPSPTTASCDGWPALVVALRRAGSSYAAQAELVAPDVAAVRDWFADRPLVEGRQVMSHGDVDQKNLLLTVATPWLVDWDVAMPWIPEEEALRTAMSLAGWSEPPVARAFLASYTETTGTVVDLCPELLSRDLILGIDRLDRCLRIASGLQPADARRVIEARWHSTEELRGLPRRVAIAADLLAWTTPRIG